MDKMLHCSEEKRLIECKGIRSHPAAHTQDVKATATHVADEVKSLINKGLHGKLITTFQLKNLSSQCATASLAVTVRTEPSHSNQPMTYRDDILQDFIELLFGMDFDEFALKFEAYALFHIKGAITGDNTLDMEWKHYETKIVNLHQVMLVSWPVNEFDPHVLGIVDLNICGCTERPGANVLLAQEHQELIANKKASGEILTKVQKKRADAGKKRGSKKRVQADDSDKENEWMEDRPSKRKSKKTHSASSIPSDEDSG
ncbi:hypothetical protein K439DRAFT_1617412 [Ramaria rubella]|nr:hypothetical protein K439DRAFT_1617412 [Ramaria rubella]